MDWSTRSSWLRLMAFTPGLPDLPQGPELRGWSGSGGPLSPSGWAVVLAAVAMTLAGIFLFSKARKRQSRSGDSRWRKARERELVTTAAREHRRHQSRGPILVLPDPDRRVTMADVRLLQRFGAGADARHVLGVFHAEVDRQLPAGTDVILCVENLGRPGEQVVVHLDGHPAALEQEPESGGADRKQWLRYAYRPECHGLPMEFVLQYVTAEGTPATDRYTTRHGFRELERPGESATSPAAAGDRGDLPGSVRARHAN